MYTVLAQWLAVAALLGWGAWLCRRLRLPEGFGPVLGVVFVMTVLQLLGSVRLLLPGAALLLAAGLLLLCRGGRTALGRYLWAPGVLALLAGVVTAQVLFAVQEPVFVTWDEFSHLGIFYKSVFYGGELVQLSTTSHVIHQAYPQGLPALYALLRVLLPAYRERDIFFITDLPLFAAAGAAFAVYTPRSRAAGLWHRLCAMAAAPLFFHLFTADYPYISVYWDAPVAALFAAGIAVLAVLPADGNRGRHALAVGLLAAGCAATKEIGTVFGLCLLGIWVLQCLLARQPLRRRLGNAALAAAPFAGSVLAWRLLLIVTHRTEDQFASMQASTFLRALQQARSGEDLYLYDIRARFINALHTRPLLLAHYNAVQMAIGCTVIGLGLAAALLWLCRGGGGAQLAVLPVCMALYWPCYCFVLFYVYICGMSQYEAQRLASFERYILCFFIGWLATVLCLAWALWQHLPAAPLRAALPALQAGGLAAASLCGFVLGVQAFVSPVPNWRIRQQQTAAAVQALLPADAAGTPLLTLSADPDNALKQMYYYRYELYPGTNAVMLPDAQQVLAPELLPAQMPCTLLLFGLDPDFAARYASYADDGLAAAHRMWALYRVDGTADAPRLTLLGTS